MKLKEFIKQFVCSNTLIRLWYNLEDSSGHELVDNELAMEHQILGGTRKLSAYSEHEVVGVTDILVSNGRHVEAVNIVIERK